MAMLTDTTLIQPAQSASLERIGLADSLVRKGCHVVEFPRVTDPRGNLTYIESGEHTGFDIRRVYYLYDVPGGSERGGHAHKNLIQVLVAMSGSFDVVLDDAAVRQRIHLNRPYYGLFIPKMVWRELDNFSSGSVCMVLASEHFDESDYYRDWDGFKVAAGHASG